MFKKFSVNTAVRYHFQKPFNWELDKTICNTTGGKLRNKEGGEKWRTDEHTLLDAINLMK